MSPETIKVSLKDFSQVICYPSNLYRLDYRSQKLFSTSTNRPTLTVTLWFKIEAII